MKRIPWLQKPRRIAALTIELWIVALLCGIEMLVTNRVSDASVFVYGVVTLCLVIAIDVIPWFDPKETVLPMYDGDDKKDVKFCPDCGKGLVEWKYQSGFDAKTGMPKIERTNRCPSWDEVSYQNHINKMNTAGITWGSYGTLSWSCGNRVYTTQSVNCHEPPIGTCGVCVDRLVKEGKLTQEQARMILLAS